MVNLYQLSQLVNTLQEWKANPKGFEMQKKLGPVFDITCDCEDGAETGKEVEHANMIVRVVNSDENPYAMAGTRIHDHSPPRLETRCWYLSSRCRWKLAYITLPKSTCYEDAKLKLSTSKSS